METKDKFNRPIHDLRISVIDTCNFRCTYCMPADRVYNFLEPSERLTFSEIEKIARLFVEQGVRKLRITGGEPLLRRNLADLIHKLACIKGVQDISLTTNGYLLKDQAQILKEAGLNRITVSLDTIEPLLFQTMSGRNIKVHKILEGIDEANAVGLNPIKINAVVQRNVNCYKVLDLANYFKERGHIVRFIEYMDVGNQNSWDMKHVVSSKHLLEQIKSQHPVEALGPAYFGEVASRYRYLDNGVEFGFISSVTQPFCGSCTRARLSTDGKIYTCLFASEGTDLKKILRSEGSDEQLRRKIISTWSQRRDQYSELRGYGINSNEHKVEMFHIGG